MRGCYVLAALVASAGLAACGNSRPTIVYPAKAIEVRYDCRGPTARQLQEQRARGEGAYKHINCVKRFDARRLLGLSLDSAASIVRPFGLELRPVEVEGKRLFVTADLDPNRIDVAVVRGVVTRITGIG